MTVSTEDLYTLRRIAEREPTFIAPEIAPVVIRVIDALETQHTDWESELIALTRIVHDRHAALQQAKEAWRPRTNDQRDIRQRIRYGGCQDRYQKAVADVLKHIDAGLPKP